MKKGDLSINMIVVAGIALIVLLVIVMIFSGRIGAFRGSVESCAAQGGTCSDTYSYECDPANKIFTNCKDACKDNSIVIYGTDCEQGGLTRVCCKEI